MKILYFNSMRIPSMCFRDDRWVMKGSGKLIIEGNGAVLHGNGEGYGILIQKSNVEIHNLILEKYFLGIRVEAFSESISEISIQDCTFRNIQSEGVSTAIIKSGCSIENVLVNGNLFVAPISNRKWTLFNGSKFYDSMLYPL